jgi:hypothetical protein
MSFEDPDDTTEAHELRIKRCRSCNARIIWLLTVNLKNIPVDADTVEPAETQFDHTRHKSHFATCPNADQHRRRK